MDPAQPHLQMASAASSARSPSPSSPRIPGAWPKNSNPSPAPKSSRISGSPPRPTLHQRSTTYPAPSVSPAVSDAPLHLERVLSFHQRLALSLSSDFPTSRAPFSPSATSDNVFFASHSIPESILSSEDSGLTRFTRVHATSNSQSAFADTSISTAYTLASFADHITPSKLSPQLANSLTVDPINDRNIDIERIHPSSNSISMPLSPNRSFQSIPGSSRASHYGNCRLENSSSRPRIQVSESPRPSVSPTAASPTSLISIGESSMTSLPSSPIIFASPSSSQHAFSTRSQTYVGEQESPSPPSRTQAWLRERQATQQFRAHMPDLSPESVHSPPGDVASLPILATLSLPKMDPASPVPLWMPSPISLTAAAPDYVQGLVGIGGMSSVCVSPFSSSSSSRSPYTAPEVASGPSSLSGSELLSAEGEMIRMRTSAAEYAAAVMSSAWGLDDSAEERQVVAVENTVVTAGGVDCQELNGKNILEDAGGAGGGSVEYLSRGTSTSTRVVDMMKRFGGRVRRFLRGDNARRTSIAQVSVDVDVVRANGGRVSAPIGIPARMHKPRPSLTAQTYTSSTTGTSNRTLTQEANPIPTVITPVIHISPPTSAPTDPLNPVNRYKPNRSQLQPLNASRPPPQLSKPRPVSLSSLSTFGGGVSSFSSTDPESLFRPRARARSSLPVNVEIDGFMPDVPVIRVSRRGPPGLTAPSAVPVPRMSEVEFGMAPKKKNRRFSLSGLSSLMKKERD